jgi:hypothetical protein
LEYADEITLGRSIALRVPYQNWKKGKPQINQNKPAKSAAKSICGKEWVFKINLSEPVA